MSRTLHGIRELGATLSRTDELVALGEFPSALHACAACERRVHALGVVQGVRCVREQARRVAQTRLDVERGLEASMARMCARAYERDTYAKLVGAYELLDKYDLFVDQLNAQAVAALHAVAAQTLVDVLAAADSAPQQQVSAEELRRKEYKELCGLVKSEQYRACLVELSQNLWNVMKNYYRMFMWHGKNSSYSNFNRVCFFIYKPYHIK